VFHAGKISSFCSCLAALIAIFIVPISATTFELSVFHFLPLIIIAPTIASKTSIEITIIISTNEKAPL
jgi:hypothetical protein